VSRARIVAAGAVVAGCAGRAPMAPVAAVHDGISIALHASPPVAGGPGRAYALVDDRRWIEVDGGALVLDRIAADVALESLVIEAMIELERAGFEIHYEL
jgi:hypothetical protein